MPTFVARTKSVALIIHYLSTEIGANVKQNNLPTKKKINNYTLLTQESYGEEE
jgi:hypothetical protein